MCEVVSFFVSGWHWLNTSFPQSIFDEKISKAFISAEMLYLEQLVAGWDVADKWSRNQVFSEKQYFRRVK